MRPLHLILVHGTWGRGFFPKPTAVRVANGKAPYWFEKGSQFRTEIEQHLSEHGYSVNFHAPEWSGRNLFYARRASTRSLLTIIDEVERKHPEANVAIVAHSHGGNAALHALKIRRSLAQTNILVTMSTPFLSSFDRQLHPYIKFLGHIAGLFLISVPAFVGLWGLSFLTASDSMLGWILAFIAFVWFNRGFGVIQTMLTQKWKILRRRILNFSRHGFRDETRPIRVFAVRRPFDEAAMLIGIASGLEFCLNQILKLLGNIVHWVGLVAMSRFGKPMFISLIVLVAAGIVGFFLQSVISVIFSEGIIHSGWPSTLFGMFWGIIRIFGALLMVVILTTIFLAVVSTLIAALLSIAFGLEYALLGFSVQTNISETPFGVSSDALLVENTDGLGTGLSHSVYNDPIARKAIIEWLNVCLSQ